MSAVMSLIRLRVSAGLLLLAVELLSIILLFQILIPFDCNYSGFIGVCIGLRTLIGRALSILAVLALFAWARPESLKFLTGRPRECEPRRGWLRLHAMGITLIFTPLVPMALNGLYATPFWGLAALWISGAALAATGFLLWLAPAVDWMRWLKAERFVPVLLAIFGFFLPECVTLFQSLWSVELLATATLHSVAWLLAQVGPAPGVWPSDFVIGIGDFLVMVGEPCSGIEGFVLVTSFVGLYAMMFRDQTRFPHFWLLLPVGLLASWLFNVARIALLIWLGANVSPDLAVNGFHSFAGWLFFTILTMTLLIAANSIPWLQKDRAGSLRPAASPPLRQDWTAARIVPFIAFMLASIVTAAFFLHPDLGYPVKAAAIAVALLAFGGPIRQNLSVTPDPLSIIVGLVIGMAWIATPGPAEPDTASLHAMLEGLAPALLVAWIAIRVVGTVLLVPIVEELFFRGYLLARLAEQGAKGRWFGLVLSSAFFAALHGRWLMAGVAGLALGALMLRRGLLGDAILAHGTANLVVAIWALARNDWSAI